MGKTKLWLSLLVTLLLTSSFVAVRYGAGERSKGDGFPSYVYRSAQALHGYQLAVANQELLTYLPCYCGCGEDPSFKNLKDCFIADDGQFNPHGANCLVCLEEVEDAMAWDGQGLSLWEIRARIDAKYEGRGAPTDTPPVEVEGL